MKFIHFIFLFSGAVIANCNENWEHVQKIESANTYVVQKKSFFYFSPFEKYKSDNLFLIKGDSFYSYFKGNGYIFGNYIRKNGSVVSGWLKAETLVEKLSGLPFIPLELSKYDFVIISPYKNIELGSSYEQFYKVWGGCEINKQPYIGISGNFITRGGEVYKYFDHQWDGFAIRSSNINFNQVGTGFDFYRITSITVSNNKYMTNRGIVIGDTIENIITVYGKPLNVDKVRVTYKFKNSTLSFGIKDNVVDSIVVDEQVE